MKKLQAYVQLIRPQHYAKNIFIFAPLFFALKITHLDLLLICLEASIGFFLISGAVYVINDYRDIAEDRLHIKKKLRPLAAGTVTKKEALILTVVLLVIGSVITWSININVFLVSAVYFGLNVAYSLGLKHVAIVDIFIVSLGFVLRLFVGAAATNIPITNWIVILTFMLAMFLSLAKRRDDVLIFNETGKKLRKSIEGYNLQFVDSAIIVNVAVMLVAYILYTISAEVTTKFHNPELYVTSIFVVFGVFRYLQLTFVQNKSGSPVGVLMKDRLIQTTVLLWLLSWAILIYVWQA